MQDDMVNMRRFGKDEEEIYSDFFNYSKTFVQVPTDKDIRVGFESRQVESFKHWEVSSTVISEEGFFVIMKLQNDRYYPIIVKIKYLEPSSIPFSIEQIV